MPTTEIAIRRDAAVPASAPAAYPGADAFRRLLGELQAPQRPPPEREPGIYCQPDTRPGREGRSGYYINLPTDHAVREVIADLMATVDAANGGVPGSGRFTDPVRLDNGTWASLGEVVVEQPR